jgi:CRP/FNR family cyclic AMP-dependent transcriptional regulator
MARSKGSAAKFIERLRTVPLFSNLNDRQLRFIVGQGKEVFFPAGREICKQGETGLGMHVVLEGQTKVQVNGRTRAKLGPGAFFGEIALLDGGPRTASVIAETDVHTLAIPHWNFRSLLKEQPPMALKMLEEVCKRLREGGVSLES